MERPLNSRQKDVLQLLCVGHRNSEIARKLQLSERSIKSYIGQMFLIFNVSNRTELALQASKVGIVPPSESTNAETQS
jgi:two-component system, NarL family, nitrate/nitrite response regulator NarL